MGCLHQLHSHGNHLLLCKDTMTSCAQRHVIREDAALWPQKHTRRSKRPFVWRSCLLQLLSLLMDVWMFLSDLHSHTTILVFHLSYSSCAPRISQVTWKSATCEASPSAQLKAWESLFTARGCRTRFTLPREKAELWLFRGELAKKSSSCSLATFFLWTSTQVFDLPTIIIIIVIMRCWE